MMADSGFQGPSDQSFNGAKAGAYRADLSVGLRDFFEAATVASHSISSTLMPVIRRQDRRRLRTPSNTAARQDASDAQLEPHGQGRSENREQGLETRAVELDVAYKLAENGPSAPACATTCVRDNSPVVP